MLLVQSAHRKLLIPTEGITKMILDLSPRTIYPKNETAESEYGIIEGSEMIGGFLVFPELMVASAFLPRYNYLTVRWQEGEKKKEAVLAIVAKDAAEFVGEIESVTGKPITNAIAERKKLKADLKEWSRNAPTIEVEREAWLGGARLKRGTYRIVVLNVDEEQAFAELYLLAKGGRTEKDIFATAGVTFESIRKDTGEGVGVRYADLGGVLTVDEIVEESRVFRPLPETPLIPLGQITVNQGTPSIRVPWQGRWDYAIDYVEFNGEPAFRFPVGARCLVTCTIHLGHLYVTKNRLAWMADRPGGRDFNIERNEVEELRRERLQVGAEKYSYVALSMEPGGEDPSLEVLPSGATDFWDMFQLACDHFEELQREVEVLLAKQKKRVGALKPIVN